MYIVDLATLREEVRQRCDLPTFNTTSFITKTVVDGWINRASKRLMERLAVLDEDYYTTTALLQTQATVPTVSLPPLCYKITRLVWVRGANDVVPCRRATQDELMGFGDINLGWNGLRPAYDLIGNAFQFWPTPDAIYNLRLHYVKLLDALAADTDALNLGPGWEEWILADVCARCARKEERIDNAGDFDAEKLEAEAYIREGAANRDAGEPKFVRRATAISGSTRQLWDRRTLGDA